MLAALLQVPGLLRFLSLSPRSSPFAAKSSFLLGRRQKMMEDLLYCVSILLFFTPLSHHEFPTVAFRRL
jgi:hypothetical protein